MARIELREVGHAYHPGGPSALRPLNLTWDDGGAYALLGPSGCGKTTMLNIMSGLVRPSQGRVLFDGHDVTDLDPRGRNIAQVFQFPVIYDTMTVFDNLAFPLRNRGIPDAEVTGRVVEIAEMLDLGDQLRRRAAGLTADAKQKISLGRGLVRTDVAAVLFDEPLTVINPHMKFLLRRKLKQVHEKLGITFIYVTHDQNEALTFADKVVVMHEGDVVQIGSPQDLFERPAHTFVGHFIGSPGMNLFPCAIEGAEAKVDGHAIPLDPAYANRARQTNGMLQLGIRPEFVRYHLNAAPGRVAADITDVQNLGIYKILTARMGGHLVRAKLEEGADAMVGRGWLSFPPEWTRLYVDGDVLT